MLAWFLFTSPRHAALLKPAKVLGELVEPSSQSLQLVPSSEGWKLLVPLHGRGQPVKLTPQH
jgi:hypothetical protein